MGRARALIANAELDAAEVERALVLGLLEDEFGADIVNDSGFQSIVDQVVTTLRNDDGAKAMLEEAIRRLLDLETS